MTIKDSYQGHLKNAGWNRERLISLQKALDFNSDRLKQEQLKIHQGEYPHDEVKALQKIIKEKKEVIKDTRKEVTKRLSTIKHENKKINIAARSTSPYKAFKEATAEILPDETINQIEQRAIQLMRQ